jgi:hypothetical protein
VCEGLYSRQGGRKRRTVQRNMSVHAGDGSSRSALVYLGLSLSGEILGSLTGLRESEKKMRLG